MGLPTAKIEDRALSTLRNIIDEHPTMQPDFKRMDKEMCWDGFIWIYNGETDQSKETYDDKVPVQIKGHIDRESKYINKKKITYSVDKAELRVYFKSTGELYFVIFMSEDGKKKEVFYASLFPSKIRTYLDGRGRRNTKTKKIPFIKLDKTPEACYIVVKQFSMECRNQGFGVGPVVQNVITDKDLDAVETITAFAVGACNEQDFFEKLSTGDVCIYGTRAGSSIACPLKWDDNPKKIFAREAGKAVEKKCTVSYIG